MMRGGQEPLGSALQDLDAEMLEQPEEMVPEDERYWFARSDDAFVAVLKQKEQDWFDHALNHGYIDMWLSMLAEYYGKDPTTFSGFDASQVEFEGDDAELVRFRINELRSYVRQSVTRATRERPAFKSGTLNTNFAGSAQVQIVDAVAGHVYDAHMGEKRERRLVERGELFGKMWVWTRWDEDGGELVEEMIPAGTPIGNIGPLPEDMPSGQMVRAGEPVNRVKAPWDVIEDPTVDDEDDHCWRCVRERRSKWELIGRYPHLRDDLKEMSITQEIAHELSLAFDENLPSDDDLLVKHVYHPPSGELQQGAYLIVCGDKVLERMTWEEAPVASNTEMPLAEYAPAEMVNSSFAYSDSWDQLVVQQMLTQLTSDCATNLSALGRQFLMLPQGSEITPEQLANGMFAAYVPEDQVGKIAAPNLAQIGSGAQWFIGFLQKMMQVLGGQNSVSRGDPADNIKSGTMAALFHAIALEHGHIPQASLDDVREKVCMTNIDFVRRYSRGKFLAKLVGEDEAPRLEYFRADILEPIKQVYVKTTNPMLRSRAGQIEMANFMKDVPGAITTPAQAIQVFTTGQIKPVYRGPEAELQRVQAENERLRNGPQVEEKQVPRMDPMTGQQALDPMTGQPAFDVQRRVPEVPAEMTDNPYQHINEHLVVKHDPTCTPEAKQAVDAHIAEHLRVYRMVPPELAAIRGFPPIQAAAPMPEITSPGGGMSDAGKKAVKGLREVEETGVNLPKPAGPPEGAAVQEA